MQQRDHHDWTSEAYVDAWVTRQQAVDRARTERFQLMCDLLPVAADAAVTILDVGAGYGPVSKFLLDQFPNAVCIAQDGSAPMLQHAQQRMASYGTRFITVQSDLFDPHWLPAQYGPFDAVVSALCLHNLRDFQRIRAIYGDIGTHLTPGGIFLNLDLVNAPSAALLQRYGQVAEARRQREATSRDHPDAPVQGSHQHPAHTPGHAFPANLDEHLAALRMAGFAEVDCFWKDLRHALYGGYL
jgi:cyclopropane fatty-acyl-phospholipid synthase-like methyltransferase